MITFSIIIPTFNSENSISKAINSILNQTFLDYEILIIDGLSKDATLKIVNNYKNNKIKVFSEKDDGIYDAMNKGQQLSKGEWIYFLGSDDMLFDDKVLDGIFQFIKQNNPDVIYGNVKVIGNTAWAKDNDIYAGQFSKKKILYSNICHQCIFYRKQFADKVGQYNTKYKISADWDYNLRCWAQSDFLYVDKIIAYFIAGGESTINSEDKNLNRDFLDNIIKYFSLSPFDPIINSPYFHKYQQVLALQKGNNYIKYISQIVKIKLIYRIKNKIKRMLH